MPQMVLYPVYETRDLIYRQRSYKHLNFHFFIAHQFYREGAITSFASWQPVAIHHLERQKGTLSNRGRGIFFAQLPNKVGCTATTQVKIASGSEAAC